MIYIGIDPGKKGGISVINDEFSLLVNSIEMPLTAGHEIDVHKIRDFINIGEQAFCIIEKAQSMPSQGVKSMFSYGVGYGELLATLKLCNISFQEIHPSIWKKEFSLNKKSKADSCDMAAKLFPGQSFMTERGRIMDGKAESLLLAEYAKRKYKGLVS